MAIARGDLDIKKFTGTAAAAGGTFTADYALPTDVGARILARTYLIQGGASHLVKMTALVSEYVVRNNNGALAAPAAIAGSANPDNSGGLVGSRVEVDEFAGGSNSTAAWTISGTNMRLTVTNQHLTQAADVLVIMEVDLVA